MFVEFIVDQWYLFAMLAFIVVFLLQDLSVRRVSGAKMISPLQLPQFQSRTLAIVVDVNEPEMYQKGHIVRSINFPFSELANSIGKLKKKHHGPPIIISCETGKFSSKAVKFFRKNQFTKLYILNGGLIAWRNENLPLEHGK